MIFAGKGFGSSQDGAVGDDQWNKDSQYLVKLVGEGFHQQFGAGYKGGDNNHKGGQPYGIANMVANQRDYAVGADQYHQGGNTQSQCIDYGAGYRQQRAETQQLDQRRVVVPESVFADFRDSYFAHCPAC